MNKLVKLILLWCCCFPCITVYGQTKADTIYYKYKTSKNDTNKVNAAHNLFVLLEFSKPDSALYYAKKALALARQIDWKTGIAFCYADLAYYNEDIGNFNEALRYWFLALRYEKMVPGKKGDAKRYYNIGNLYFFQGNYPGSIKYHLKALRIWEELKDKKGIADVRNTMGGIYMRQENYERAIQNYKVALKFYTETDNLVGQSAALNNLGACNFYQVRFDSAFYYHQAAIVIRKKTNDMAGLSSSLNNIGLVYKEQKQYDKAMEYYLLSLHLRDSIGKPLGIASSNVNIGELLVLQKDFKKGISHLKKAESIALKLGVKEILKQAYYFLADADSATGDYKSCLEHQRLYEVYNDSLNSEEARSKTLQLEMAYDFEKKEAIAKAEHKKNLEREKGIREEKETKQKIIIGSVIGGLAFLLLFAVLILKSLRTVQKQKRVIEEQKKVVENQKEEVTIQKMLAEEKQKEVMDSIHYAKRIQSSQFPTEVYIVRTLKKLLADKK